MLAFAAESLATYRPLELVWQTACSLVLAAYGALMLGDAEGATRQATEAMDALAPIGDSWGLVHAQAMLGGIAQAEHRLDDAAGALAERWTSRNGSASPDRRRSTSPPSAASSSGPRRGTRPSPPSTGPSPPRWPAETARLAATTRVNLARLHRARGDHAAALALLEQNQHWYRAAGGGDGALLNRCLLGAEKADPGSLQEVLTEAAAAGNAEVQVYALDALARCAAVQGDRARADELLASADSLAPTVTHLVDEADRFDKLRVHQDTTA